MTSHTDGIRVERGIAYGHGQALDVYTPLDTADVPVVLLWHGLGANQRDVLEPLARTTAAHGWQPSSVVCLAPGFRNPAPTTGNSVLTDLTRTTATPVPFWLVHGTKDPVVDISQSREFAALLAQHGWPVHLEEVPTDHAGVVMARYDPDIRRSRPATNHDAIEAGRLSARVMHAAASGTIACLRDGVQAGWTHHAAVEENDAASALPSGAPRLVVPAGTEEA